MKKVGESSSGTSQELEDIFLLEHTILLGCLGRHGRIQIVFVRFELGSSHVSFEIGRYTHDTLVEQQRILL